MAQDLLTEYQKSEMKRLARFTLSPVQLTVVLALLGAILLVCAGALFTAPNDFETNEDQRRFLTRSGAEWAISLAQTQEEQADWLRRRGIGIEQGIYARLSYRILQGAQAVSDYYRHSEAVNSNGFLAFALAGSLRVGFLLIACMRLILACGVWAWWSSRTVAIPYRAKDALGQTGNGRLFFSGISVNLDERDADGSPARQVAGLACPERVLPSVVAGSSIAKILDSYGASNAVNLALTAILLRYRNYPDHVAYAEDQAKLDHSYETGSLGTYVEVLLAAVLRAHKKITVEETTNTLSDEEHAEPEGSSQIRYAHIVGTVIDRLLSPRVRSAFASVPATEVATLCLALEAGKILLFVQEGGKWSRRSHFPELSARAVLHSCPEFSDSYRSIERTRLRRALVFSGEPSIFAPIRVPQDLSLETQSLLSVARVILAQPHELAVKAASEELAGLLAHIQFGFERIFFASATELDPDLLEDAYAWSNVLLLKLPKVMTLLRQVIDQPLLDRLHELVGLVHSFRSEKEQIDTLIDEHRTYLGSHDSILPPLRDEEISALATQYKLNESDIRDWSVLRLALHHFGWLGRRVSERTVPNSSIVFVVLKADTRADLLTGIEGVVPLRASRCREHWGKNWASRFIQVEWARIAESRRDFERLLSGEITDAVPGEEDGEAEPVVGAVS